MGKTFVNALAYSRVLKLLTIFALSFVVVADALVIALVIKVIDFASPEERTRIISLNTEPFTRISWIRFSIIWLLGEIR